MEKKLLLTSIVALSFAMPAFAENFPSNGLMLENKTYDNAATYTNLSTYTGPVYANAEYEDDTYELLPGTYLPENSDAVAQCESGYYCPGSSEPIINNGSAQGLTQCPSGYRIGSDPNATSAYQCYKNCDLAAFPNATSVSGHDYYGFNDTCAVDSCVAGWSKVDGSNTTSSFGQYIKSNAENAVAAVDSVYIGDDGSFAYVHYVTDSSTPGDPGTYQSGWSDQDYIADEPSFYGLSGNGNVPGSWAVGFGTNAGFVRGMARLSTVSGTAATTSNPPTTKTTSELGAEGGTNCWCNITGYRFFMNESEPWGTAASAWAYAGTAGSVGTCGRKCADLMNASVSFRMGLLNTVTSTTSASKCQKNTITVYWNGVGSNLKADGTAMSNYSSSTHTGSTTVEYNGSVVTPKDTWAPTGQRFKGWRFSLSEPEP